MSQIGKVRAFQVQHLCVRFGDNSAIDDLCHTFAIGRWTHIIGPNGAGKSTLLRSLCALQKSAGGSVQLNEQDIWTFNSIQRARHIAYVPQRLEAIPPLNVIDFVAQGAYAWLNTDAKQNALDAAGEALNLLKIHDFANRKLTELSGGELQLCTLASAIAQKSSIILLDEPTSALDIKHAEIFCQALVTLTKRGITVISTTHDLRQAQRFGDEFLLMAHGKCLYSGAHFPSPEIFANAYDMDAHYFAFAQQVCDGPVDNRDDGVGALNREIKKTSTFPVMPIVCVLLVLLLVLCPWIGATWASPDSDIFWMLRIPRVLWGLIAGSVLALSGATLQAMFQNSLATPYTLGIASGASFGAMIAIQCGISSLLGLPALACLGGIATMAVVLLIASRFGLRNPIYCLLAGVAASMFCSAAGLVIQAFATPFTAQQMMRWQLGGLEIVGYRELVTLPLIALACFSLFWLSRPLELISVDSELAVSRGVNVEKTRMIALLCAGISTSIVVSICGPIGFVGLIIPNAVRRYLGADLRRLFPVSALCGAIFLMVADTISRMLEGGSSIPVGVVTALVGAPIFIYTILKNAPNQAG